MKRIYIIVPIVILLILGLYLFYIKTDQNIEKKNEDTAIERVNFGQKSAYIENKDGKIYLIFSTNGQEKIIDEATIYTGEETAGFGEDLSSYVYSFEDLKFSPLGNYLIYYVTGYEWQEVRVYDIKKDKIILAFDAGDDNFTPDEKYFYSCVVNEMWGTQRGNIYNVPDFRVIYDLFKDPDNNNSQFYPLNCEYNDLKKTVTFKFINYDFSIKKVVEYYLLDNKAKTLK